MSGGGSRSHRPSADKGLAEGAGRINALTPNDNFGDRPHQTAHTGRTKVGTDRRTLCDGTGDFCYRPECWAHGCMDHPWDGAP